MQGWLLRRLAQTIAGIWLLASAVFLLSRLGPGADDLALGDASDISPTAAMSSAGQARARQALRQRLGLSRPLFYVSRVEATTAAPTHWRWHGAANQYHDWLCHLLQGDLGYSIRTGQRVSERIQQALAHTIPLTGTALLLTTAGALLLAQWLAAHRWGSRMFRAALAGLQALPLFIIATTLLLLFANPALFDWFPVYRSGSLPATGASDSGAWASGIAAGVLPVVSLVLAVLPTLVLQLESALVLELRTPYANTARAKGLTEKSVVRRHALRNAMLPLLTQFTGLLPILVAGAVVVEVVFAVPGMGRLLADAAATRDYPVLVGAVAFSGTVRLLGLLLADVLYFQTDPRIRWQR